MIATRRFVGSLSSKMPMYSGSYRPVLLGIFDRSMLKNEWKIPMLVREPDRYRLGKRSATLHDQVLVVRAQRAFDVGEDDQPAALDIVAQPRDLGLAHVPAARLGQIRDRVVRERGRVQTNDGAPRDRPSLDERRHRADVAQDAHEVRSVRG